MLPRATSLKATAMEWRSGWDGQSLVETVRSRRVWDRFPFVSAQPDLSLLHPRFVYFGYGTGLASAKRFAGARTYDVIAFRGR